MTPPRIFLIGLMGSGKSYWGEKIATLLKWKFIDLDKHIIAHEKMGIPEIFEKRGENYFRNLENKYLKDLLSLNNVVIAAGGGTPCFQGNMEMMNQNGETYYLKVKPETSAARLKGMTEERPLLKGKSGNDLVSFFTEQLKEREPFYSQASHIIDAEKLDENKLKKLFTLVPRHSSPPPQDK